MDRLRKRPDFLAVAKGRRAERLGFVIQARGRMSAEGGERRDGPARFGLTVTKKIGNAVMRNRIRRRLREAVRQLKPDRVLAGTDYVLMARQKSLRLPFAKLTIELEEGMAEVNRGLARGRAQGPEKSGRPDGISPAKRTADGADGR